LSRVERVENRASEPTDLSETLEPPVSLYWGETGPEIGRFLGAPSIPAAGLADALEKIAAAASF
jgi:hypothetical protein